MKSLAIALLTTAAFAMPAMAQNNAPAQSNAPAPNAPAQNAPAQNTTNAPAQSKPNEQQPMKPMAQSQQQGSQQNGSQAAQNNNNNNMTQNKTAAGDQVIAPRKLSRADIRELQTALNKDGDKVGRVDGRWGPETRDALQKFQQVKGIQAKGRLTEQTVADLGLNTSQFTRQGNSRKM